MIDYPLQYIRGLLGQGGSAELAFAILVGAVAMMVIAALGFLFSSAADPTRRRLRTFGGEPAAGKEKSGLAALFRLRNRASNKSGGLHAHLLHAGYEAESAATRYRAIRVLLMVSLPILIFLISPLVSWSVGQAAYGAMVACGVGYLAPSLVLSRQEKLRMIEITNGFPDALDLLVACTEAGMGLNAALQRVGEQLVFSHPAVAQEFNLVNYEIRGGVDRMTALRNLSERTGLASVRSLVGMMSQTIRYGTSVADTLRVFAEDLRDKRMQAAEEAAAKLGTKMIFPLIFCLFPSFFIVAIGPAVLGAIDALGNR